MHCCWHNHCILLCVRVRACVCMCASVCVVQETRYSSFFHSRERQVFSFAHNKNSDAHKLSNTLTHIHTAKRQTIAGLVCTDLPFGPPERIGALKYRNFVTTLSQTRTYNPPDSRFSVCVCVCVRFCFGATLPVNCIEHWVSAPLQPSSFSFWRVHLIPPDVNTPHYHHHGGPIPPDRQSAGEGKVHACACVCVRACNWNVFAFVCGCALWPS